MGSFDPSLNSFTDIKYLGTKVDNGKPVGGNCTIGYDNAAFVIGTSSSLFNQYLNSIFCEDCHRLNSIVKWVGKIFMAGLSDKHEDVAEYKPNPFYKSQYAKSENITNSDALYLIDGGLSGEGIPLSTVMTKERALDVAFAFDNTRHRDNTYPDATVLIRTYEKQFLPQGKSQLCPYVPDANTFLQLNLTAKPTFFGCDAKNLTALAKDGVTPPLVIYFTNRPFEFLSNTSTEVLTYTDVQKKGMIQNGLDVVTRMNGTIDEEWRTCVACAVIRRSEEHQDIQQSEQCKKCFKRYCWDGTVATTVKPYGLDFTNEGLTKRSQEMVAKNISFANLKKVNMVYLMISTLIMALYI